MVNYFRKLKEMFTIEERVLDKVELPVHLICVEELRFLFLKKTILCFCNTHLKKELNDTWFHTSLNKNTQLEELTDWSIDDTYFLLEGINLYQKFNNKEERSIGKPYFKFYECYGLTFIEPEPNTECYRRKYFIKKIKREDYKKYTEDILSKYFN